MIREKFRIPPRIKEEAFYETFKLFGAFLLISVLLVILAGIMASLMSDFFDSPTRRVAVAATSIIIVSGIFLYIYYRKILSYEADIFQKEENILFHRSQLKFTPFPILFVDTELKVKYANEITFGMFQTTYDELIGREVPFGKHLPEEIKAQIINTLSERKMKEFEVELPTAMGTRTFQLMVMPVFDAGKPAGFVMLLRDLTELRCQEKEREKLFEQLLISQKSEALGRIAGNIAHDFNNLLTVIIGNAELLKSSASEDQLEMVESIISAGNRGKRLVRNLLSFSQRQPISKKHLELNSVLDNMLPILKSSLPENISLEVNPSPKPIWIYASESQIEQAVLNLVVNARDVMPDGGSITISIQEILPDSKLIEKTGFLEPKKYAVISVKDTGPGIDPEIRGKIFDPYFSTKPDGKGTGLGLSIVLGIARNLNGTVEVESEPGKGTEFKILIPVSESIKSEEEVLPLEKKPEKKNELEGLSVLLVEDDDEVRSVIEKALSNHKMKINGFHSGKEALEHLEVFKNYYDLIIIDCVLTDMIGSEFYKLVRSEGVDLPVLFISGYFNEKKYREIPERDRRLLLKPFTAEELIQAIKEALGSSA